MSAFKKVGYALTSPKEQDTCDQVLKLKEHGIETIFSDDFAVSRSKSAFARPGFGRLWATTRACNLGINQIWVDDLSRIGRSIDEITTVIKKLNDEGIEVVSLSELTHSRNSENSSPLGKIITAVCFEIAENERKRLKERNALRQGKEIGRIPSDIPRNVVESMRNRGLRWCEIARRLNCDKVTLWRRRQKWKVDDICTTTLV